jgi:hypothetical protein
MGFSRQVNFRISQDDWPLLERASREHGGIAAALVAGLRSLPHGSSGQEDGGSPVESEELAGVPGTGAEMDEAEAAKEDGVAPAAPAARRSRAVPASYGPSTTAEEAHENEDTREDRDEDEDEFGRHERVLEDSGETNGPVDGPGRGTSILAELFGVHDDDD